MKPLVLLLLLALTLPSRAQFFDFQNPAFIGALGGTGSSGEGGGSPTDNNVVHDAFTESAPFTTTTPHTFAHTPVGTPKGVVVLIATFEAADGVSGVTYGGVAMARITNSVDSAGEPGRTDIYFLGSSIPTGEQDVVITHSGSAALKDAVVATVTADGDTSIADADVVQGDAQNPQVSLDSGTSVALRYCIVYSGNINAPANLSILANMSAMESGDEGASGYRADRETTKNSGAVTVGYTAGTTDDVALSAVAIK